MEMHRAAKTILKRLAVSALTCSHPLTVTEGLETVLPNVQEIIFVNIALDIATVNVGTCRDGAVNKYRADGNPRAAEIVPVANLALERTYISLATKLTIHLSLLSSRDNEVH